MRKIFLLSTVLASGLGLASAHAEAKFSFAQTPGELPKTVVPSHYTIDVVTDLKKLTLTGKELVDVKVVKPTNVIVLNQAGLTLQSAKLNGVSAKVTTDEKAQTATLTFPDTIKTGTYKLEIAYTGPIPATPNGIYYDDYHAPSGGMKRMLVTQFEVADARRMFPGWDEPAFKATFQLNVTVPADFQTVSNMPITTSKDVGNGDKRVSFQNSPRMSTYLLALVAGDMSSVDGQGGGTPIKVWAPTGNQDQGRFALSAAEEILPYYNGYFGVKYPLPKMDMLAIPGNYEAGAMENWGALTYIDNDLLFDPKTSSPDTKEMVYLVVAHEMAHQWSGDLVTMGWWNNIWLNEGFATWMETKATDHFNPTWEIWPRQHFDRELAMGTDARSTTHAIQQIIHNTSEANSAFDSISYQKGSQVIRMIENWLGEDVFRAGMRDYMKAHQFGNATSADLWAALSKASGKDVAKVAASFTEQPGIPLVHVATACQGGKTTITLTQSRFTIHDPNAKAQTWSIPVVVGGPGVAMQKLLLENTPAKVTFAGCNDPIKVNAGENGYYRTIYDAASLKALAANFTKLDAVDRANLLGDQFALFEAGQADLSAWLDLVAPLAKQGETNIAVLDAVISGFSQLQSLENGASSETSFKAFVRSILAPQMARLGWEPRANESFLDQQLRPQVISALGLAGDQAVIDTAKAKFAAFVKDNASLPPSLVKPVTALVGRYGDAASYDALVTLVHNAPDTEHKLTYFAALTMTHDPALITRTVAIAHDGSVPNGRIGRELALLARNSGNPGLVWSDVEKNQTEIRKRLAPWSNDDLLSGVAQASSDPAIAEQLKADPQSSASPGAKISTARAVEAIAVRRDLTARAQSQISAWLAQHH